MHVDQRPAGRQDISFNPVSHLLVPLLGGASFVPAWAAGAGIKIPGASFITPLPAPLSYMGPGVAAWMVIGVGYLIYLYLRDPQRVLQVGSIYIDGDS